MRDETYTRELAISPAPVILESMISLSNDVHENVHRFNQEEAMWRRYEEKRARRRRLLQWLHSLGSSPALTADQLDQLDWLAAESETHASDCLGKDL